MRIKRKKESTVIITGANGNIGSVMAACLAEEGYNLLLLYHNSTQRVEKIAEQFSVSLLQADITKPEALENSVSSFIKENKLIPAALIHTAAVRSIDSAPLISTSPDLWRQIIETNLLGTYNILKTVTRLFINNPLPTETDGYRRIVLLGSDVSRIGLPRGSAYAASKAAISNLARSVSNELAVYKILINTVSPGPVEIDDSHFNEEYRRFRAEYYAEMLDRIPLQRLARSNDITSLCRFLISEENKYITGEEFFITGGKL